MFCIYCGNNIMSEEHIIPNALGGKYKSSKICCKKCNNGVLSEIDAKFCDIFSYIIYSIPNLKKGRNNSNRHSYTAYAYSKKYDDVYQVNMKSGNITSCEELSKLYHSNFNFKEFKKESLIFMADFKLDNDDFKNGLFKIAFQYAIEKGVDLKYLKKNVNILETNKGNIMKMKFDYKYKIIPFIPLNIFDIYLEDTVELSHTLILFNEKNLLCCYVDLFNTFQYYILLSDEYKGNDIYYDYYISIDDSNTIDINTIKNEIEDYKMFANYIYYYKIDNKLSYDEIKSKILEHRLNDINNYNHSINKYLDRKISIDKLNDIKNKNIQLLSSIINHYYENDKLIDSVFRKYIIPTKISYPMYIIENYSKFKNLIRRQHHNKFYRLEYYLNELNDKIIDENKMKYYEFKLMEKFKNLGN